MDKESWNHLFTEQSFGATIKLQKAFYFPFPLSFPLGLPDGFRLAAELAFSFEPDFETSGWTSEKRSNREKGDITKSFNRADLGERQQQDFVVVGKIVRDR